MVRLFGSQNAVLMRLSWAANESQFYSSIFGQSRLNRFYQPNARYKNRPDSMLGSVRLEIAARVKARFFGSRLHDPARLGSSRTLQVGTRVTSTRLDSARLSSAGYSGFDSFPFLAQAQLGAPYLDWGSNSMLDSAQLGVWLGLSSGSGRS